MAFGKAKGLSTLHCRILEVLEQNKAGVDIVNIRKALKLGGTQQHLDRRVRDLDPYYIIERVRDKGRCLYVLKGKRPKGQWDYEDIPKDLRARILFLCGNRCQMCGKNPREDGVKLHIDHKIPRSWGGETVEENLWALCSACNEGKKNYFGTFDDKVMRQLVSIDSVHLRIASLLHLKAGEWVDADLIEFVSNCRDYQADWRKRLRELRYAGLKIEPKRKLIGDRSTSAYKLTNWLELPDNLGHWLQEYERKRAERNRSLRT